MMKYFLLTLVLLTVALVKVSGLTYHEGRKGEDPHRAHSLKSTPPHTHIAAPCARFMACVGRKRSGKHGPQTAVVMAAMIMMMMTMITLVMKISHHVTSCYKEPQTFLLTVSNDRNGQST